MDNGESGGTSERAEGSFEPNAAFLRRGNEERSGRNDGPTCEGAHMGYQACGAANPGRDHTGVLQLAGRTVATVSNHQAKTGEHVYVPVPKKVSDALRAVPHRDPQHFFWSGHSKIPGAVSVWRKPIAKVFKG